MWKFDTNYCIEINRTYLVWFWKFWNEISCIMLSCASFSDPPNFPQNLTCVRKTKSGNVSCTWTTGRDTKIATTCQLRLVKWDKSALQEDLLTLSYDLMTQTKSETKVKAWLVLCLCAFQGSRWSIPWLWKCYELFRILLGHVPYQKPNNVTTNRVAQCL